MSEVEAIKCDGGYRIHTKSGNYLGDAMTLDCGYLGFWCAPESLGAFSPSNLRAIADKMDELDKPWDDQINAYCGGANSSTNQRQDAPGEGR